MTLINGTTGNDTLTGGSDDDEIHGLAGDDILRGKGGKDTLFGDEGKDTIYGGKGMDEIHGGAGRDTLYGGDGDDIVFNASGKSELFGEAGNDELWSGTGSDTLKGGRGDDKLFGNDGNDRLYGGEGTDELFGHDGDDYLNPGNNSFFDWINAGTGIDTIDFTDATGADAFYNISHSGLNAGITASIDGAANTGHIDKGAGGTTTLSNVANALAGAGLRVHGTGFDDTFNITPGNGGEIQVRSSAGDDIINIGVSTGQVYLGFRQAAAGVNVDLGAGAVSDDGLGGSDTITGPGQVSWVYGSFHDDILKGSAAGETFSLYGGNDMLKARGGYDTLDYARGAEGRIDALSVDLQAGSATGTIDAVAFSHTIGGIEAVIGSDGDDVIRGSKSGDTLEGGEGADTLDGRKGSDTLKGGGGNDSLKGGKGGDILKGGAGKDSLNGGAGNDTITGGAGADTIIFSNGADVLTDFNAVNNLEKIDLSGVAAITDFTDLKDNHATQAGSDLVIDDGGGNTLTLEGLNIGDLDKADFIF